MGNAITAFIQETTMLTLLFPAALLLGAQTPETPTLEQILAKHFEAMGGEAKLASIKSIRIHGTTKYAEEASALNTPELIESKQPDSIYQESMHPAHGKMVRATAGAGGWSFVPAWESTLFQAMPISARSLGGLRILGSVGTSPFLGYKAKGYKAEYQGMVDCQDGKAHKILLAYPKDGIQITYFLDSKSWLVVRAEGRHPADPNHASIRFFGNYKIINGINVAHIVGSPWNDNPNKLLNQFVIEKIEFNPKINDARFQPRGEISVVYSPMQLPPKNP
jgi:hypothetical protein